MDYTNLSQIKKVSFYIPLLLGFFSIIPYSEVKKKGLVILLLVILFIGILTWISTIFLLFLPRINEKRILLARIFCLFDIVLGLFNFWLMFIVDFLIEVSVLLLFLVLSCAAGCLLELKKDKLKVEKVNLSLIGVFSCSGIIVARILANLVSDKLLLRFSSLLFEFLMIFLTFFIGMLLHSFKSTKN